MSNVITLWFSATFSADPRFLDPGRELAVRVAASLGYVAEDAAAIGTGVGDAVSRAVALARGTRLDRIELTFKTLADQFEITVLCANGAEEGGAGYFRMSKPLPEKRGEGET